MKRNKANLLLQSLNYYGDMDGSGRKTFRIGHPIITKRRRQVHRILVFLALVAIMVCIKPSVSEATKYSRKKTVPSVQDDRIVPSSNTRTPREPLDGMELRKVRRMAIGLQAAGVLGLWGALLEVNFSPDWSLVSGYGGGEGFQALEIAAKYVFPGESFLPYLEFGYSRWSSVGKAGPITKTTPSFLVDKLLTDEQKLSGEYQKNLLFPAIGVQFVQLGGDWAGSSVFAEVNLIMDVGNFLAAPTGSLGFLYYF